MKTYGSTSSGSMTAQLVLHMPCGCPYPPIGDHTPCEHGDCGHCEGTCIKLPLQPAQR